MSRLLYKSKVEYMRGDGVYTLNHVIGCTHGCVYCYAFKMAKRFGQVADYNEWCTPKIKHDVVEQLERELDKERREKVKRVHLCFSTDPFPYPGEKDLRIKEQANTVRDLTERIILALNGRNIPVSVLTKGQIPLYMAPSFGFHPDNEYGATVTTLDARQAKHLEPNAIEPMRRYLMLEQLAEMGAKTWLSIEPFGLIHPTNGDHADLEDILEQFVFVRKIVFGKANYVPNAYKDPAWYQECADIVERFCAQWGIEAVIKKGIR